MCGRFGASYRDIKSVWNVHGDFSFQKRYNIAPSQEVPVIIRNEDRNEAKLIQGLRFFSSSLLSLLLTPAASRLMPQRITLSTALASTFCEITTPICFAVFKLM